jgi:hypothetical protein
MVPATVQNKKADAMKHPLVLDRVGLLFIGRPETYRAAHRLVFRQITSKNRTDDSPILSPRQHQGN